MLYSLNLYYWDFTDKIDGNGTFFSSVKTLLTTCDISLKMLLKLNVTAICNVYKRKYKTKIRWFANKIKNNLRKVYIFVYKCWRRQ